MATPIRLCCLIILLFIWRPTNAADLFTYSSCCNYCRGEGELWVESSQPWNLTVEGLHVTSFANPSSYFVGDSSSSERQVLDGLYTIHHAGAPLTLTRNSIADEAFILSQQYIQVDLGGTQDITAVSTQGGYYAEEDDELLDRYETWMTSFALSYSVSTSTAGPYTFYRHEDGYVQVFNGNSDATTSVLNSLSSTITTRALRVHPLEAASRRGSVSQTLVRLGVVVCNTVGSCSAPRVNCEVGEWSAWGECSCDWQGCNQERMRQIYRYNSCLGLACPTTHDRQTCVLDGPSWHGLVQWVAIGLAVLVVILVVIIVLVMRHKKKREAVVFDKQDRRFERKSNGKNLESDSQTKIRDAEEGPEPEVEEERKSDVVLSPRQVKVERRPSQESMPDMEKMYRVQRDEYVAHARPVLAGEDAPSMKRTSPGGDSREPIVPGNKGRSSPDDLGMDIDDL